MKRLMIVLAAIILLLANQLHAQEKDIVFEQITNESGRSLGYITGIVQDETGFMWFATRNGLYRYNGYSYKLFRNNKTDSLSLPFNSIASLSIDNRHNMWLTGSEELAIFSNEKRVDNYRELLTRNFEMGVEIVQDKNGNYWVGPTGEGIIHFKPETNQLTSYTCPMPTYSSNCWKYLDSLLINCQGIAEIRNPYNDIDTSITVTIIDDGHFLIASTGESDTRGLYDFGSLKQNNSNIWQLAADKSMWAGGAEKNRFQAEPIFLKKGNYQLTFKSDMSHTCNNWEGDEPNKIDYCGIKIVPIAKAEYSKIKTHLFQSINDTTFIESNNVKDILVDNTGSFWFLSDKGIHKYNYKKHLFELFPIDYQGLLGNDIKLEYLYLFQDKTGIFWISSNNGLIKYDNIWSRFEVFQNTTQIEKLTSNAIHSLFEDDNKHLWIGTDKGITIYDQVKNTFQKVKANNHNRLYNDWIIQIFEDKGGNIWVATSEGLNRLIKDQFTYTNLGFDAANEFPVEYDENHNLWIALGNKIIRYSPSNSSKKDYVLPDKLFPKNDFDGERDYIISDMVGNAYNSIWLAIDNKICHYSTIDSKVDGVKEVGGLIVGNDSLKNNVKQLMLGKSNQLYAFCSNGIYGINQSKKSIQSFYSFNQQYDFIEDVDQSFFKTALIDKKGNIWLRTSMGIFQFNTTLQKLELVYEFDDLVKGGPLTKGAMDVDKYGNLWFATLPSLHVIYGETLKHQSYTCSMENEWGTANCKMGKNNLWIYSTNGLYSFKTADSLFIYYSEENGLVSNNINGMEEDSLGYIWLTTIKGLSKLDIKDDKVKNFFTLSDFTSHTFLGNHEGFKTQGSDFIFFTTHGFVSFNPNNINSNIPKVIIDKFTLRGKEYDLDSLIYYKNDIRLKYNQNFIGFEFAVLDYTDPAMNRYKFKLEGLDEDWNYTDADNRKAGYSGIAPGSYVFRVCGANNDKVWNEVGVSININIKPPWYKTILAYIIYIILTTASIWMFIRIREKNLKEEKRILEQKVKERTAKIESQKEEIQEQHKNITDSIHYAKRIQSAILPPTEQIAEVVDDFFILYRPRDIVSGDYYWVTRRDDITIIVAADCTGHGVPGAFMSMLGVAFLNEIVNKEGIIIPNLILNRLREQIIRQLHQTGKDGESKDGMDVSLYVIDHVNMKLQFSGAYNPLYVIRNDEVIQLKADRMPIGYHIKMDTPFTMEVMDLLKGDCLYNSSDGYPDQFGGDDGRKFMSKNFRDLLLSIHKLPMCEQREILNKNFDKWRGKIEQIDDVVVLGVRV